MKISLLLPQQRIRIILHVLTAACITAMLLSHKLWISDRNFPLVPFFHRTGSIPSPFDHVLFYTAITLLAASSVLKDPLKPLLGFLLLAFVLCLADQNRLQPWFFQYCMMIAAYCFSRTRKKADYEKKLVIIYCLMNAAVYFWSGLQKLNIHFPADIFPWLMEPFTSHMKPAAISRLNFLSYCFPFIETATGVLLLTRWRITGLILSILMHIFILYVLSPLGHNYNPVVWPWNIAMIIFNIILFSQAEKITIAGIKAAAAPMMIRILLVIFLLLPLLNFFNKWDSYLSHNLYSGNTSGGSLYITDRVRDRLPASIRSFAIGQDNQNQINIKYWCMQVTGVPAYPENRIFEAVRDTVYKYATDSSEVLLVIEPKLKLKNM